MKDNNMMSYEMYEDFKETMVKTIKTELSVKNNQSTDNDLSQRVEQIVRAEQERQRAIITQLAGRLESIDRSNAKTQNGIDNLQSAVEAIEIPAKLPPRITQHRVVFSSESPFILSLVLFLFISCMILSSALYFATRPNHDRIDNDLKYRYIKMKGEATPERIAELEELFELNRDNGKIRQMRKDVEEYEQTIRQKIVLEEQAKLKEREANRLECLSTEKQISHSLCPQRYCHRKKSARSCKLLRKPCGYSFRRHRLIATKQNGKIQMPYNPR